jgi:hypothetical protein
MAGRQAKTINVRSSQVTDITADPSMGGDPLPAPITFLARPAFANESGRMAGRWDGAA